mmetsp:Transcript_24978/g.40269  ORF Transcript_24978/g.40269 Transcript_24978/m.40269 type:complete len:128 (+) Transcript_24978:524-907(+)
MTTTTPRGQALAGLHRRVGTRHSHSVAIRRGNKTTNAALHDLGAAPKTDLTNKKITKKTEENMKTEITVTPQRATRNAVPALATVPQRIRDRVQGGLLLPEGNLICRSAGTVTATILIQKYSGATAT